MRVELFNGESDLITINRKDVFFVGEIFTDGEDIEFKGKFFVDDEDGNKHPTEIDADGYDLVQALDIDVQSAISEYGFDMECYNADNN